MRPGLLFDAVIYPNPPLSKQGFIWVVGGFALLSTVVGTATFLAGAWPVVGFCGLDVMALTLAFWLVRRRAKAYEAVQVDRERLTVQQVDHHGRSREWRFRPYFTRIEMDQPVRTDSLVRLRDQSMTVRIGAYLTPPERLDFVKALQAAVAAATRVAPL